MSLHNEQEQVYQLLSSTRFDSFLATLNWNNDHDGPSPFFLLPYHIDRLACAAKAHRWDHATSILSYDHLKSACLNVISEQRLQNASFRIRILLSRDGQIVLTASPLAANFMSDPTLLSIEKPPPIDHSETFMKIYMDTEAITPSIFTSTKTTFRDVYDLARTRNEKRLQPGSDWSGSDILLYNDKGGIMETTIFNVAFYRSSKWVTPPSTNSGCLPGVMRRWLLQSRRIFEDESRCLTKDSIQLEEWVLLFNGVQGCRLGKVYM